MFYPAAITRSTVSETMSKRYVPVNTEDVITIMGDAGFTVDQMKVDNTRKNDPSVQRHLVIFRNAALSTPDGTYTPQMLWMNSHNGKSRADMRLGIYRFVCANGIVVGTDYGRERVRHMGADALTIMNRVKSLTDHSMKVFGQIDTWSKIDLSPTKRLELAQRAGVLRFGEAKVGQYQVEDLLCVRRTEDDKGDLWSTFNRIQENATKGGLIGRNANNRQVRSKALNSIGLDMEFNQKLWNLTEEYAV